MKVFLLACLAIGLSGAAAAQNSDDYKKVEFFAGYSNGQIDTGGSDRQSLNGFNVQGVYNLTRYIGVKGDFSATFDSQRVGLPGFVGGGTTTQVNFKANYSLYNVLGGIQIKDNANEGRLKPFAHALFGVGRTRSSSSDFVCSPASACTPFTASSFTDTGFAAALGGGLDIRLNKRIQLRLIQVDYNPVRAIFGNQNNIRLGAGIVF